MFNKPNKHQFLKNGFGFWAIPILFASLLLPLLALAKSSLPSLQLASVTAALPQLWNQELPGSRQQHRQLLHQSLSATASPIAIATPRLTPQTASHKPRSQPTVASTQTPTLELGVAIAKDANVLAIATSTSGELVNDAGKVLKAIPAGEAIYAQPSEQGVDLNAWQAPPSVWIKPKQGGYVFIGEHWYRGRIRLIREGSTLLAVNYVKLEDYLYSVVGSEMPSYWPLEALKAQAIAARSYALVQYIRPASPFYQLGSTEAWQVYKGLDGETSSTHQAVDQTWGQFLSYQGGLVESLYASTDEIVIDAHKGRGMSQTGAFKLASQGHDYRSILGSYYPGTKLAKVEIAH